MDADALLAATYRGDTRAFESLVRSQAGRLHRIASRITGDASLADDVLQETFLRILRVPAAARPSRAGSAWLARVTVRVGLNLLQSERARRRREERYARERSEEMKDRAPMGVALPAGLDRPVADALASLSPETRAALWLHVVEGEGVREVAALLDSSRSAVSRRVRAGLEALRACLAKGGVAGVAALKSALRGSESPPPEAVVRKIVEAGRTAMNAGAASVQAPDALDAAIAAPLRSSAAFSGIGVAAIVTLAVVAALAGLLLLGPSRDQGGQPAGPIAAAPVVPPASEGRKPESGEKRLEPAPPLPAARPALVSGTIRNQAKEPIPFADVYLASHPPRDEDLMASLGSFFRADYFKRSRFLATKADSEGRYGFERVPELGSATLSAFQENHSGALNGVTIADGAPSKVDLILGEGETLTGRVLARDGSPVADAVVSTYHTWSPKSHVFQGAGIGATDADGRFRLGLGAGTTGCHVRVNSDIHGQAFFVEVPVKDEGVELTFQEPARAEGTITWTGGVPASGLTVRVNGRLPEPPIPVERMGLRPFVVQDGLVGRDGKYRIEGLHPKLIYDIFVIDGSLGEKEARKKPLSAPMVNTFRLGPGEVKVWNHSVPRPITIKGHIRTETTATPLPEGQVGVRKDGKKLGLISAWADGEGFFEMHLNTGPGEYRIHAEPPVGLPSSEEVEDLIDARFGRTVNVTGDQAVEVDLTIFEPAVFPLRVVDHTGTPVKTINTLLTVTFPNGKKMGHEGPCSLDDAGRKSFTFHFPASEFWYGIAAVRNGPTVATRRYASVPGTVLPEETITLPRACDLAASLLDPKGNAYAEQTVYVRVVYEDGSKADFGCHTDKIGALREEGCVRAAPFVLEIRTPGSKLSWKSPRLDGSAGGILDLGKVVLSGEGG